MESLREEKYWSEKVVEDFQIPLEKISEILAVSKKNGSSFDFERLHQYLDLTENFKNNLDRNNWPVWCFIAFAGNTELAKKISDFGVLTHNGMNALHFAIVGANFAVARYFIDELKRDPRACDSEGNNASYFAALIGSPSICAYLYKEYGVDPRVKNSGGKSALDIAVEYKRFHVLEYFVLESDLDLREFAESIFSFAVKYKKRALVENLYKKYAHNFQKNPLYSAIDAGSVDAVRCLIEKCGMVPDVECLHRAVVSGNSALIVHLIELCGLDPRATNCNGENALHIAAASDQTAKIVKMLMAYYGVDPLIESAEGTPLKRAQVAGNETCVALLGDSTQCHELVARSEWKNCVSEDFKLSAEKISEITQLSEHFGDLFDFQKLHQRLSTKNIRLCMSLDENTPVWIFFVLIGKFSAHFLNAKKFFVTALHLAAFVGELALVKMLVEKHHRDANERGGVNGWNALHFAVAGGSLDVTKYLTKVCEMDPGVSENREIYWRNSLNIAVDCDSTNVALYLICVWGINPRRTSGMDGVQNNALHRAAIRGNVELIKSFVADIYLCKMDPTVENKAGKNALHLAAENHREEAVKFLVGQCGMDPTVKTGYPSPFTERHTALELAAGNEACCALLDDTKKYRGVVAEFGLRQIYKLLISGGVENQAEYLSDLGNLFNALRNGAKRQTIGPSLFNSRFTYRGYIEKCDALFEKNTSAEAREYFMEAADLFMGEICKYKDAANPKEVCFRLREIVTGIATQPLAEFLEASVEAPALIAPRAAFYRPEEATQLDKRMRSTNFDALEVESNSSDHDAFEL